MMVATVAQFDIPMYQVRFIVDIVPLVARLTTGPLSFPSIWLTVLLYKISDALLLGILNCFTLIQYVYLVNFGLVESIPDIVVIWSCVVVSLVHVVTIVGAELLESHLGGSAVVTRGA